MEESEPTISSSPRLASTRRVVTRVPYDISFVRCKLIVVFPYFLFWPPLDALTVYLHQHVQNFDSFFGTREDLTTRS